MKHNSKKGFTLIELLAVILILGIIALIAIPTVTNIISESKASAFKSSAYEILSVLEDKYTSNLLKGESGKITFTYTNGVESSSIAGEKLDYKGSKPKSGTATVDTTGKTAMAIYNGKWCAKKNYSDTKITMSEVSESQCTLEAHDILSNLTLNSGGNIITFNPSFSGSTLAYSATVDSNISTVTVTPTVKYAGSTIQVNGTAVASGSASSAIALTAGTNNIVVKVIGDDGTSQEYTVTVLRTTDNTLANIIVKITKMGSALPFSPTFSSQTVSYSLSQVTAVNAYVTITLTDPLASAKLNGTAITSGTALTVPLTSGTNILQIEVTPQQGIKKTYTITMPVS